MGKLAISCLSLAVAFAACTYDENRLRPQAGGTGGALDSGNADAPIGAGGVDGATSGIDSGRGGTIDGGRIDGGGGIGGVGGATGGTGGVMDAAAAEAAGGDAGDVPITGTGGSGGVGGVGGTGGTARFDGGWDVNAPDVPSNGGALGTGGVSGRGGGTSTGGSAGAGGVVGTGGASGTGGTTAACQEGATECSGNGVRTCTSGQWSVAVACGPRQTCTGPAGTAKCTCNVDPVCTSVGGTCSSASVLANCAQDTQACFYQSSATACANGACSGPAGSASCCTNVCTAGATQCLSSTSLQTCTVGANGCTAYTTTTCTNGACFGAVGSALCCTNACTVGTTCLSGTTLEICAVGANGCTATATTICICAGAAGSAACVHSWAQWPMPNGPADVAAGAPNLASYTDNGNGTVTDNVTGLMWQQAEPSGRYTWAQAKAYCPTLTLAGHNDWRLPTRIELVSLVDFGSVSGGINTTYFTATLSDYVWSSSPLAGSLSDAWYVFFGKGGFTDKGVVSSPGGVRCVR